MKREISGEKQRVVVLGASPNPERYSNKAVRLLIEYGHEAIPVHPAASEIEGIKAVSHLDKVTGRVDTLSMYVSPGISNALRDTIIGLNPGRVIFNPGTEHAELIRDLKQHGIPVLEACTLVMLHTGQF